MSAPLAWVRATGSADGTGGELAQILGAEARLEHLRYKPGYSLLARVVPTDNGPPSWFALFAPEARDKVSKLRRGAKKSGIPLIDIPMPRHPEVTLLSGPIGADLRLRRRLRAVRGLVDRAGTPKGQVLAYNPWKRIVQVVDSPRVDGDVAADGEVIAKVSAGWAAEADDAVARVLADLAVQGVPVLEPVAVPTPGTQLLPYVRGGDLARLLEGASAAGAPAAEVLTDGTSVGGVSMDGARDRTALLAETGEALALLHGAGRARVERALGDSGPLRTVDAAARLAGARNAVATAAPHLRNAFDRVADAVADAWEDTGPVLLHGDFSTDQVLVGDRILLNDLDRVCVGAAGFDLGSFAAVELLADRAHTIDPFITAYAQVSGQSPVGVYGWTALHVLLRCTDPVRDLMPGHIDEVARRIELAEDLVDGAGSPRAAGRRSARGTARRMSSRPLLPPTLVTPAGELDVARAWPAADGTQRFEGRDADGRLRAGTLSADGDVAVLPFATDDRLPGLSAAGLGLSTAGLQCGELLVHRVGRRAVVRRAAADGMQGDTATDGAHEGAAFVKHVRSAKVVPVVEATKIAGRLARAVGFSAPEVVTADAHSLTVTAVPGVPLLDVAQEKDLGAWRAAWETWRDQWPRLVRSAPSVQSGPDQLPDGGPVDGPGDGPGEVPTDGPGARPRAGMLGVHDGDSEAEVVATWTRHLLDFDPLGWDDDRSGRALKRAYLAATEDVEIALREGARHTSKRAGRGPTAGRGIAHRDLHDGQMLVDPATGALGLLDFDTLAYAEPELDLGNLISHMRLRHRQGALGLRARNIALAAIDRAADTMELDENRLRVYTRASALRLVGVYAFRPQWRDLARELCESLVR
ncbi:phosphotransferase [Brevibacterium yomogidense]|uniref:phosphotransferase n=1 Tax=Brevibacterium yomogidense TaxID=946573 RepID=UPI0018DF3625|nr:phosphotransferase [Brevibacterium yomogidense]